jgi:hypothetical protein
MQALQDEIAVISSPNRTAVDARRAQESRFRNLSRKARFSQLSAKLRLQQRAIPPQSVKSCISKAATTLSIPVKVLPSSLSSSHLSSCHTVSIGQQTWAAVVRAGFISNAAIGTAIYATFDTEAIASSRV